MGYVQDEVVKAFGAKIAKRIGVIAAIVVGWLLFCSVVHIWPFSVAKNLAQKVVNADSIVYNYQWYTDQFNQIQATKANLSILEPGSVDYKGTLMVLNQMIGEYNARASQVTRNLWMPNDGSCPYQIELVH